MLESKANLYTIIETINDGKYVSVNFEYVSNFSSFGKNNTIEFRCSNGSLETVIWQNNVNLFVKLLEYSKSRNFDDDLVSKRHSEDNDKHLSLDWYNEIYLQQALELCDMIFTTNIDKVYFLRQYLKSFQISDKTLQKAKQFIKN